MENKYKTLTKNTFIIGIGNIGSSMISFFLIPVFTNFLTASEYGKVDFIIVLITLLVPIFTLNFTEVIIRFGLDKKYNNNEVFSTVIYSVFGIFILNFLIIIILSLLNIDIRNYWWFSILLFVNSIYELLKHYVRAIEKVKLFAIGDIIYTIIFCIMNIFLIVILGKGINGYLIAYFIANLAYIIYIIFSCKLYMEIKIKWYNKCYFKEFFQYSLPLIPNSISNWIINVSDRIIIKIFVGYTALGIYSISSKITQIINTFYGLFFKAWQISSIKELNKKDTEQFYSNIFNGLMKLMFGIEIIFFTFINILFYFFIGKAFDNAIYYVPILITGVVFYTFSSFFGTIYTAHKKSKEIFKSTVIAAIINIVINIIFMPIFGAIVACFSTLISYLFLFLYRYFDSKKIMKLSINIKELIIYLFISLFGIINIYFFGTSNKNIYIGIILLGTYCLINLKYLINIISIIKR